MSTTGGLWMTRLSACVIVLSVLSLAQPASAQFPCTPRTLGLGLGGGNLISGVSVKRCLTKDTAVQGVVGGLVYGVGVGADYLVAQNTVWTGRDVRLRWGVGAGTGLVSHGFAGFGGVLLDFSAVVELVLEFKTLPIEVTTDWRPGYLMGFGSTASLGYLHLNGGGGAIRWYFR